MNRYVNRIRKWIDFSEKYLKIVRTAYLILATFALIYSIYSRYMLTENYAYCREELGKYKVLYGKVKEIADEDCLETILIFENQLNLADSCETTKK